ncbi:MAG TPA: hypothetical protein DEA55_00810 [Rhodospirillaceae bacterium]|nr:hypothetical protein [Rhodospirillaceae bacterium]
MNADAVNQEVEAPQPVASKESGGKRKVIIAGGLALSVGVAWFAMNHFGMGTDGDFGPYGKASGPQQQKSMPFKRLQDEAQKINPPVSLTEERVKGDVVAKPPVTPPHVAPTKKLDGKERAPATHPAQVAATGKKEEKKIEPRGNKGTNVAAVMNEVAASPAAKSEAGSHDLSNQDFAAIVYNYHAKKGSPVAEGIVAAAPKSSREIFNQDIKNIVAGIEVVTASIMGDTPDEKAVSIEDPTGRGTIHRTFKLDSKTQKKWNALGERAKNATGEEKIEILVSIGAKETKSVLLEKLGKRAIEGTTETNESGHKITRRYNLDTTKMTYMSEYDDATQRYVARNFDAKTGNLMNVSLFLDPDYRVRADGIDGTPAIRFYSSDGMTVSCAERYRDGNHVGSVLVGGACKKPVGLSTAINVDSIAPR